MYDEIITSNAKECGLDEKLVRAIISHESSWEQYAYRYEKDFWTRYYSGILRIFNSTKTDHIWFSYPTIVSASYGLMQIMLITAIELGFRFKFPFELFDPANNIKYGCLFLKKYYGLYHNWSDVISAYNQGNNRKNPDGSYVNQTYVDTVNKLLM